MTYQENEDFVPNPTDQFGTLDTSGTAGAAHSRIEEISQVFAVADQQNALTAAKAVDPDDDSVPASAVVLPEDGGRSREEALQAIKERAEEAEKKGDLRKNRETPAQAEAAESGEEAGEKAETERPGGAGSGATDGSGTGHTEKKAEKKAASNKA